MRRADGEVIACAAGGPTIFLLPVLLADLFWLVVVLGQAIHRQCKEERATA
jgi:hypothetical protein